MGHQIWEMALYTVRIGDGAGCCCAMSESVGGDPLGGNNRAAAVVHWKDQWVAFSDLTRNPDVQTTLH